MLNWVIGKKDLFSFSLLEITSVDQTVLIIINSTFNHVQPPLTYEKNHWVVDSYRSNMLKSTSVVGAATWHLSRPRLVCTAGSVAPVDWSTCDVLSTMGFSTIDTLRCQPALRVTFRVGSGWHLRSRNVPWKKGILREEAAFVSIREVTLSHGEGMRIQLHWSCCVDSEATRCAPTRHGPELGCQMMVTDRLQWG